MRKASIDRKTTETEIAVSVDLDTGLRFGLGIGVAADVRAPLDDQNTLAELGGHPLGDRQAEEAGADDEQVIAGGRHQGQGYPTGVAHGVRRSRVTARNVRAVRARAQEVNVAIGSRFRIVTPVTAIPLVTSNPSASPGIRH